MKREFVMLSQTYDEAKHGCAGWFMSEKLDGQRIIWDGGLTRGMKLSEVPFANREKDDRYVDQNRYATGLWSRNAKPIFAPDVWLDKLPRVPLDGEAYIGRGLFQTVSSIIKQLIPSETNWNSVKFCVFDSPTYNTIFADGVIEHRSGNNVCPVSMLGVDGWAYKRCTELGIKIPIERSFESTYRYLRTLNIENDVVRIHEQEQLPYNTDLAREQLLLKLTDITDNMGEGVMLRKAESVWVPERSWNLLKVKKWNDSEAKVIGYIWGKKTDRGSKLMGKMGAAVVEWQGKIFELSGFTDAERILSYKSSGNDAHDIGRLYEGQPVNTAIVTNEKFPIGSIVTFRYNDLTDKQIPKCARYYRKPIVL